MADIIWQSHSGNWDLISAVDTSYAINTISAGKNVSPNSPAMKILCTSNKDLPMFFWQKNHFTIAFLVDNRTKFYMIDPLYPKTSNNGSRNMQNAIKMLTEARINGFQDLYIFKTTKKTTACGVFALTIFQRWLAGETFPNSKGHSQREYCANI